jgi:hypothetical protein
VQVQRIFFNLIEGRKNFLADCGFHLLGRSVWVTV